MTQRSEVAFPSGGVDCAAYLYRPADAIDDVPCVVMAHGFTATRDDLLPAYAERFVDAGCAVLVFDYRHFGASGGQPRQLLDVGRQHADYHAAIGYARSIDGVDPSRIVLWGSSFSGGHVIAVAADDPRIAAVISQVPFTDGLSTATKIPPVTLLRLAAAGVRDAAGAALGRPPHLLPAVGSPGQLAAMTDPEAAPGFRAIVGAESLWRNEFAARLMLTLATYRPGIRSERLGMPLLVCVADGDRTTPPEPAVRTAQRAPRGELRRYPVGHFGVYVGDTFEQVVADQVDFLGRHVVAQPR
ncbi:MAG: alpha/beta fold hydrolase [Pseudonocardiaceae bacterium]|nr:alpha/beta fold hydrolase [Pseudonocardiaceae bacterium]